MLDAHALIRITASIFVLHWIVAEPPEGERRFPNVAGYRAILSCSHSSAQSRSGEKDYRKEKPATNSYYRLAVSVSKVTSSIKFTRLFGSLRH